MGRSQTVALPRSLPRHIEWIEDPCEARPHDGEEGEVERTRHTKTRKVTHGRSKRAAANTETTMHDVFVQDGRSGQWAVRLEGGSSVWGADAV